MDTFRVLLIAVDDYPDPPGRLRASESADGLAELVIGERGGVLVERAIARSREDVLGALERWAESDGDGLNSTLVYLAGHGTDNALRHSFIVPAGNDTAEIATETFDRMLKEDWLRHRQSDRESWTLFVLDCCAADTGVANLTTALNRYAVERPRRLALWPTTPQGATHSGRFVEALGEAIETFKENDETIPLNELFMRLQPLLGDLEPAGFLPRGAALRNQRRTESPIVMNLDAHAELQRVIADLPPEVRAHFLHKAQGTETGDLAWYFEGREREIETLSAWLANASAGLRVVTGEAGSGKSALLGYLSVLADDTLVDAYVSSGLAPDLRAAARPPSGVFDASVHLTGKLVTDLLDDLYVQVDRRVRSNSALPVRVFGPFASRVLRSAIRRRPETLIRFLRRLRGKDGRPFTVLLDALDEAQEPVRIAELVRRLVSSGTCRVLIGTRRSLDEGLDRPADPDRRELLDALRADDDELIVLRNDRSAMHAYVLRRLGARGSPYADLDDRRQALAERISSVDAPFLFARLATTELLARPPVDDEDPLLGMLDEGHAGIFGAAVKRIAAQEPAAAVMLRALALAHGRGLPEAGHTWLTVARAIAGGTPIPDTAVRTAIDVAAAYVTLDAEGGQSVYRLAHRTFVEHFIEPLESNGETMAVERDVAAELVALVARNGGWPVANHYLVRYLPLHLEAGLDLDQFAAVVTDPEWLVRAIGELGVDLTIDSISGGGPSTAEPAQVLQKALRRSRIALSRDPAQLAGQMTARLREHRNRQLAGLGRAIAAGVPDPSLHMVRGALDWRADLETTYGLGGRLGALAFGRLGDRTVLAIGIDDAVHVWDPLRGTSDVRVIANDGRQVMALAFGEIDGRPVLAVASYGDDKVVVLRDAVSGERLGEPFKLSGNVTSLAIGRISGRSALAGCGKERIAAFDMDTRWPIPGLTGCLPGTRPLAVSELDGRVVAHAVHSAGGPTSEAWVVDVASGEPVWPEPMLLDGEPVRMAAGRAAGHGAIVTALVGREDHQALVTWSPEDGRELHRFAVEWPVGTIAVAEVDSWSRRTVVACSPDYESTALVTLTEIGPEAAANEEDAQQANGALWIGPDIEAMLRREDGTTAVLCGAPLSLRDLATYDGAGVVDANPSPAVVTYALTGRRDRVGAFIEERPDGVAALIDAPAAQGADEREHERGAFWLTEPIHWPRTATARGFLGDRAVVATGSIDGAVWLWDGSSGELLGGPLAATSPHVLQLGWSVRNSTGAKALVESVALGRHPEHGDIAAIAARGRVRLVTLPDGGEIPNPADQATVVTAVALGRIFDEDVLITGSKGGVLVVSGLATHRRIAALTLDGPIERVWVVRGADSVAAKSDTHVYVMDLLRGAAL